MDSYKRILVPYDGSEHSERALAHAIRIAGAMRAEITLLHVLHPPDLGWESEDRDMLDEARKKAEEAGVKATAKRVGGSPREEIAKEAEQGYDIIVMGSRGLGGLTHILLGSVAEYVVRHSKYPVMIVR